MCILHLRHLSVQNFSAPCSLGGDTRSSWPLESAALTPRLLTPTTPALCDLGRVPSWFVFIRGEVLCKLTVSGSLRPPFIRVLPWQPRHPQRQSCWGPQLWGDTQPVPLVERDVFSNLGRGAPHTRERGRGGAGGGVPPRTPPPPTPAQDVTATRL